MALDPGTNLGPYEIRSHLGSGGMGEVYLAYDPRLERSVALKVLPPEMATDRRRMHRFIQEAKTTSSLNHPNLLTIYEISQESELQFIATEFIDGVTLREQMNTTRLRQKEILTIIIQVCRALAAAHDAGVVHRDIKPENIMLRHRDQIVKVLDFGLAKLVQQSVERPVSDPDALTKTFLNTDPHIIIGTIRYMSPEQTRGLPVDGRTDIWSVGVVMYEMIANRPPFEGPTTTDLIVSILDREPLPITDFAPDTPLELQRIIKKALSKDREKRYQSVADLAVDLDNLKLDLEINSEKTRSSPSIQTPPEIDQHTTSQVSGVQTTQQLSSAGHIVAGIKLLNKGVLIGLALAVFALAAFFYYTATTKPEIDSIAVLPFVNSDGDPNLEYLSDGIAESITDSISQLPGLSVIARSSVFRYKGKLTDPQTIGRQLRVRAVVTGRIVQRGDRLVLNAELVDVENNHRMWGGHYDRRISDILAVQSEIAHEISEQLRIRLTIDQQRRLKKHHTENTEAYQAYLKGRFHWNKRTGDDLKKAIEYFNRAIEIDPTYALAYAGLGDTYVVIPNYADIPQEEAYLRAKASVLKALELDDSLAEAHNTLAGIKTDYEWDYPGAEIEFKKALTLNPNYATAYQWYAHHLSVLGRHDEAIAAIRRGLELDPLSLIINAVVGDTYIKARRYDDAINQLLITIEMDKNFIRAHRYLAHAYLEKGMYPEAITEFQIADTLANQAEKAAHRAKLLREAFATGGAEGFWRKELKLLQEDDEDGAVVDYAIASAYARLGDQKQTLFWLEKAYNDRDPYIVYLYTEPQFDFIRSNPRVIEMLNRLGFPQ